MPDLVCDIIFDTVLFTALRVRRFWLWLERS